MSEVLHGNANVNQLNASTGDDEILNDGNNVSIDGGAGNDTLTGGDGNDVFIYNAGKDVIADYATSDKISLGMTVSKSSISGSDVIFTIGNSSLAVKNAKGKTLSMIDKIGKAYTIVVGSLATSTTFTVTNSTKFPVTVSSAVKTVNASTANAITLKDFSATSFDFIFQYIGKLNCGHALCGKCVFNPQVNVGNVIITGT